jgi:hypothetical protein
MGLTLLKFHLDPCDFINIFVLCVQLFELDFVSAVNLCMPPFDLFKSVDSFIFFFINNNQSCCYKSIFCISV